MPSRHTYRVYYEDTDAGGVVYYANYLKFAERARTEWLRELGFNQSRLAQDEGILIVVRRATIDFLAPARLDDKIVIESHLQGSSKVRMTMLQAIKREDKQLATVEVELVCVGRNGKPTSWPDVLLDALKEETAAQNAK
jgi:acyl-CoA thioester hydrolase